MPARSPEEVDALFEKAEELAATYGVWSMKAGDQELSGKTIEVVRRQPDGTWLFVIDDPFARNS